MLFLCRRHIPVFSYESVFEMGVRRLRKEYGYRNEDKSMDEGKSKDEVSRIGSGIRMRAKRVRMGRSRRETG